MPIALWPPFQDQCIAVAQAQLAAGPSGQGAPRRRRLAASLLRVANAAAPFLQVLGGRGGGAEERVNERVATLAKLVERG